MAASLYIHIPFCRRKCVYCDFYSIIYDNKAASSYIDVLTDQIKKIDKGPSSIYIGGGTPTALEPDLLKRLFKALEPYSQNVSEFTIEANPESLDGEKAKLLLDSGVNRLSIGIQSLNDQKLKRLGRLHDSKRALDAVAKAERAGFKNISADFIFGVWGETPEEWKKELEKIAKLPVTHISCYSLTYEKGTPLFSVLENKSISPVGEDVAASMYEAAIDILSLGGFKQYEVSSFAKEGFRCAHNVSYWENSSYTGLGASAVSYAEGVRVKNVSDVSDYIKRFHSGKPLYEFREKLPPVKRARETAAIKIRTKDGIDFSWFRDKTGFDFMELERKALACLIEDGLIKYKKDGERLTGICLKRKGFLFCDTVSSALL